VVCGNDELVLLLSLKTSSKADERSASRASKADERSASRVTKTNM